MLILAGRKSYDAPFDGQMMHSRVWTRSMCQRLQKSCSLPVSLPYICITCIFTNKDSGALGHPPTPRQHCGISMKQSTDIGCCNKKKHMCDYVCLPDPVQGGATTEANKLDLRVREWDRAVGLRLENAVVLAAHRLTTTDETTDTLVCAMTGVPVSADKAIRALTEKIKDLKEKGAPRLTVEQSAAYVPEFSKQTKIGDLVEILVAGRDWDEVRGKYVPCLSYANKRGSFKIKPEKSMCIGLGAIYSQVTVDNLFKEQMSVDDAEDVALEAIYFAAFYDEIEGQEVEVVDVWVITADGITTKRHVVEDLHATYGPLVEERQAEAARYCERHPRYSVSNRCKDEEDVWDD